MTREEYRAAIRAMIVHEDALRDQKLGWLFALNGLLFTGASLAWDKRGGHGLIVVLSAVGMLTALSSGYALRVSELAIRRLRDSDDTWKDGDLPPVVAWRSEYVLNPQLESKSASRSIRSRTRHSAARWAYPWRLVPVALFFAWAFMPAVAYGWL
jgi:hypothetical protein